MTKPHHHGALNNIERRKEMKFGKHVLHLKTYNVQGFIFVEPVFDKDKALFFHCAKGETSVNLDFYNEFVEPILFNHGVREISIKKDGNI